MLREHIEASAGPCHGSPKPLVLYVCYDEPRLLCELCQLPELQQPAAGTDRPQEEAVPAAAPGFGQASSTKTRTLNDISLHIK